MSISTSPTKSTPAQPDFLLLVFQQIAALKSKDEFSKKIKSLFDVLPSEATYLIEIERQGSAVKDKERQKTLDNKLRAAWLELWSKNIYDPTHEPYFQKHYPNFTQWQRFNLNKLIKKNKLEFLFVKEAAAPSKASLNPIMDSASQPIAVKKVDELTMAIKNYRIKKPGLLSQYVKKHSKITTTQAKRILQAINDRRVPQWKIVAAVLQKSDIRYASYEAGQLLHNFIYLPPKDYQTIAPALSASMAKMGFKLEKDFYFSIDLYEKLTPLSIFMEGFAHTGNCDYQDDNYDEESEEYEQIIKVRYDEEMFSNFCENLNWSFSNGLLPYTAAWLNKNKDYQTKKDAYANNVSGAILDILGSKKNMKKADEFFSGNHIEEELTFRENPNFHETLHTIYQKNMLRQAIAPGVPKTKPSFKI